MNRRWSFGLIFFANRTSGARRPDAGAGVLSGTVGKETSGTSTLETGTPETAMEEKESSGTRRPGAGARSLSRTVKDKTSGTSTPATGTPETGMEEEETSRTWRPGAGAGEVLSGTMGKSETRDPMEEQADKDADKKAEDDGGEVVQRPWSQLEGLGLSGHSNTL